MTNMKKSTINLMEEFIHEATPELILNDCINFGIELDNITSATPKKVKEYIEMKKYIGTKQIEAEPMTLGEACSKGLVKSEIEENESYKLGYHTRTEYGYESWSPKELFEESYREVKKETPICFGDAIEVLKQGGTVRRSGWNGKGLMVFKQVPAHIESDIIPKMQSLPQSAKYLILKGKGFIDYTSQCLIYNENTGRADSWVPSISDVFADDWEIVV